MKNLDLLEKSITKETFFYEKVFYFSFFSIKNYFVLMQNKIYILG